MSAVSSVIASLNQAEVPVSSRELIRGLWLVEAAAELDGGGRNGQAQRLQDLVQEAKWLLSLFAPEPA